MDKKEFAATSLDLENETYVIHVGSVSFIMSPSSFLLDANIHLSFRPQISGLIAKEAPTKIFVKYSDFADTFSSDLVSKLPEYTEIYNHNINIVDG